MFMQLTGTDMVHIPYKGTAPALVDLVGGNVDVFFDNLASSATFHEGGKVRILAVADQQRSQLLPQIPTFVEAKLPGMVAVTFFSIVAPPGTPQAAVDYAHKQFSQALQAPDVMKKFAEQGATPAGWTPQKTGEFIRAESAKWAQVIKTAKVTVE
jgi:tripartite-type tricarboxylate transporter receptor subunit TctC